MLVQCLGCGDAFSSGGRLNSAFFLRSATHGILLDCGASVLASLKKAHLSVNDVDVIVISHLHGDHFGGLPFILCESAVTGREKHLTIIGPPGTFGRTQEALACLFPGVRIAPESGIRFMPYTAGQALVFEGIRVTPFRALHSPETDPHSLRIASDGTTIGYSGDTAWTDQLIEVAEGADLFICEGSTYDTPVKHHMAVRDLEKHRGQIRAKKIVITHLGEEALRNRASIPFDVAEDGAVLLSD